MIKYYCDRCKIELTEYEYTNSCTTIDRDITSNVHRGYRICNTCTSEFNKFISGEEVKRIEKVKESQ
jgi:Zn finger protein HypA/HybF involved in hydrogenase expression